MYLLIDRSNWRFLAKHQSYTALTALAFIQYANVEVNVVENSGRGFSTFDREALNALYANTYPGHTLTATMYSDAVETMKQVGECIPELQDTAATIAAVAATIPEGDANPYAYTPHGLHPLPNWYMPDGPVWAATPPAQRQRPVIPTTDQLQTQAEQQVNASSSAGGRMAAGGAVSPLPTTADPHNEDTTMATAKKAPAKKATKAPSKAAATKAAKTAIAKAPAKVAKPAKAPKVDNSQNGISPPNNPAGNVGQVWAAADKLRTKEGPPARKDVIAALPNIPAATVSTQFQRWRKYHGF